MPKRKVEEELELLGRLRTALPDETTVAVLGKALKDRVNLMTAKAASITAELRLTDLIPDLLAAFDRQFQGGRQTDPQCAAKNALARALVILDYAESAPFLRGAHYVQMEPVWGGEADSAVLLRGTCLLALVQCTDVRRVELLRLLVDKLADTAKVRAEAVRAIAQLGGDDGILLLRLKARLGDKEASVTGDVLELLLKAEGEAATSFVAEFLCASEQEVQEEAAFALGASRLAGGVEALIEAWTKAQGGFMGPLLLRAISSSRRDEAFAFLTKLIREGRERDAIASLEALKLHRHSAEFQAELEAAVKSRAEPAIHDHLHKLYPQTTTD